LNAAASNSTAELAVAQLKGWRQAQTIPYKGDAPALLDLVGGRVQFMFATGVAAEPYLADGRLRRLGTTAPGGGLDIDVTPWMGLFAPAGLPEPRVLDIADGVVSSLQDAEVRARWAAQGFEPQVMSAPEFKAYFRLQYARFVASARRAGLRIDR
jgi:tripartite-type tricarboxylate transporter receptor subunit TctC